MTHKIIFLDFDGVLNKISDVNFNMRNVDNLNELIRKTNAKIVVTSDWRRNGGLEYVKKVLNDINIKGEVIDITPTFNIENNDKIKVPRGLEIQEWINGFNSFDEEKNEVNFVINYVILDDHMDMLLYQSEHFVKIDPSKGFDGRALKNSIEILRKNDTII